MAVRIGDVTIRIGASTKQLENDLRRAERSLQATADKFTNIGTSLSIGVSAPLAALGIAATKSFADFERLTKALESVTGDASLAAEQLERLKVIAQAPSLELPQVVKASAKLQAVGLSAEQAEKTIIEYGNAVARSGGNAEAFDGAILALTQVASKGKISAEEINQLGERIFEIRPALKAAFGTSSSEELQKLGVTSEEFVARTVEEFGKLERVQGGLSNSFTNFKDSVTQSLASLGESIAKTIDLEATMDKLSKIVKTAADYFKSLSPEAQKFIVIAGGIAIALGPALIAFAKIQQAVGLIRIAFISLQATFSSGGIIAAFTALGGPILAGIVALGAAVYLIYKNWEQVKKSLIDVVNYFVDLYNESLLVRVAFQGIVLQFKQIYAAAKLAVNLIINSFAALFKFLVDGFSNAGALIKAVVTLNFDDIPGIIAEAYKKGFTNIKALAKDSAEDFKEFGSTTGKNITDAVNNSLKRDKIQPITAEDIFPAEEVKKAQENAASANPFATDFARKGAGASRQLPIIAQLETTKKGVADLVPLFQNLQVEANKATVKKLSDSLAVAKPELNETAAFLKEVNAEIEAIQVRADRGFITQADADIEKAERIKAAIQDATQQGLGTGVVDALQGEFDKLNVNKLIENLEGKLKEIVEFVGPIFSQLGATFGAIFTKRGAEIDQYYEKEKSRIENSLMSEENKAAAIQKLDEQTQKKKAALARKQAIIDKASAIFSAAVDGAAAIIKGLKYGPIYAAVIGGLVAAQIAAIAATPLPSLAIGTDMVKSDGLAMIHKGEAIVPANVVRGGYSGGGQELYGRLSGLDIVVSNRNSQKYLNRIG